MSNIKYQAITEALSEIKTNQLDEQFNINPFRKKPPSYDEISASLSKSASRATPLPNVEFEPDRSAIHDVLDKSSIFPVSNLSKVSIPGGLAAGAYSKDGKDLSMNPNFMKAMDARNNKLLPRAVREQSLTEDGHTDVPSSIRMCKTIMEDAHDILCALCNTDMDEEIDTWWTNKLAVSASTLNKLRDYYVHEVDHEEQPDEADMEIEEQRGLPQPPQPVRGRNPSGVNFPTAAGQRVPRGSAAGAVSYPPRVGPAIYNTRPRSYNPFEGMGKSKGVGTTAFVAGSGLAAALGSTAAQQAQEKKNRNVPQDGRRGPGIQEEAIEENIDMEAITKEYGKYAIPAGAAALGFTLAGEKRKRPTFKGFLKNATVAAALGLGAEALKRQYIANNPDVTSPFLQKATVPEFKPTVQG